MTITLHAGDNREPDDLSVGTAAEHLVCFDLIMSGHRAFLSDQNCPYDIAVDFGRLIRVQVKATRRQRSIPQRNNHIPAYMWHVRRAGKGGRQVYKDDAFDILALVALDIQKIAYLAPEHFRQTIHIRPPGAHGGKHFSDYSFFSAMDKLR